MKKIILLIIIVLFTFIACKTNNPKANNEEDLQGNWELNYISGSKIAIDGLFPNQKPTIVFDLKESKVQGNSSCNNYSGNLNLSGNKITFKDAKLAMTMMACEGDGERIYMATLDKINSYSVTEDKEGKVLNFMMGEVVMMRFKK